jgi:hypothetical protein
MKRALIGVLVGIAFMLAGRGTVAGAQDPAGPGRGLAPASGRGAVANQGHNLTRPDLPNPFRMSILFWSSTHPDDSFAVSVAASSSFPTGSFSTKTTICGLSTLA